MPTKPLDTVPSCNLGCASSHPLAPPTHTRPRSLRPLPRCARSSLATIPPSEDPLPEVIRSARPCTKVANSLSPLRQVTLTRQVRLARERRVEIDLSTPTCAETIPEGPAGNAGRYDGPISHRAGAAGAVGRQYECSSTRQGGVIGRGRAEGVEQR